MADRVSRVVLTVVVTGGSGLFLFLLIALDAGRSEPGGSAHRRFVLVPMGILAAHAMTCFFLRSRRSRFWTIGRYSIVALAAGTAGLVVQYRFLLWLTPGASLSVLELVYMFTICSWALFGGQMLAVELFCPLPRRENGKGNTAKGDD